MTNKLFGMRLREQRKLKGLTLEKLAEAVDVTANFLGDVERGKKYPSMDCFIRLVNALDIPADYLVRDSAEPSAQYVVDEEISRKLEGLTAKQRKAAADVLDALIANMSAIE